MGHSRNHETPHMHPPFFSEISFSLHIYFKCLQGSRVGHDRKGTQRHSRGRYYRVEIPQRRYGNTDRVINESPEEVLLYLPHSCLGELYASEDIPYVVFYQYYPACLLCHIRTAAYG